MKRFSKIFIGLITYLLFISNQIAYATDNADLNQQVNDFEFMKYVLIIIGIALLLLVLLISYKADEREEKKDFEDEFSKDDEKYDDIKTDDEQSLYSTFGEYKEESFEEFIK